MVKVVLKRFSGHPWIMARDILSIEGKPKAGDSVLLYDKFGNILGAGIFNPNSYIRIRMYSHMPVPLDNRYIKDRLRRANQYRLEMGFSESYRMVFSESDSLPGLIVDKYGDGMVVQILTYGMEIRRDFIYRTLIEFFEPEFIYEKSDTPAREKEGLEPRSELIYGEIPDDYAVRINDILFRFDVHQKTGMFLDQSENYLKVMKYVGDGMSVIDAFTYMGGFALHILKHRNPSRVVAIDQSRTALQFLKENLSLNDLPEDRIELVQGNVFDVLEEMTDEFDFIILDPPAFTKRRNKKENAMRGYDKLHRLAMRRLKKGGYLVTFSCAYHIKGEDLLDSLKRVAMEEKRSFYVVEELWQSKDHPFRLNFPESLYLKGFVLKEVE